MLCKKLPKHTPPLGVMLEALGRPHPLEIAQALGAGERTVRRWISDDDAPRPVLLSLFWLTPWGWQWMDADHHNQLLHHMRLSAALTREADTLREHLAHVANLARIEPPAVAQTPRHIIEALTQAPRMLYAVR